jgi:hypothetical protein
MASLLIKRKQCSTHTDGKSLRRLKKEANAENKKKK